MVYEQIKGVLKVHSAKGHEIFTHNAAIVSTVLGLKLRCYIVAQVSDKVVGGGLDGNG